MISASCWSGLIQGIAPFFRWSGWAMKIPADDHDNCSAELSEASDAKGPAASSAANPGSDAIRAVLMYHLKARHEQVRTALKAAVHARNASEILDLYQEAEAVGVAQTEIDEALAVAAKICAASAYEKVIIAVYLIKGKAGGWNVNKQLEETETAFQDPMQLLFLQKQLKKQKLHRILKSGVLLLFRFIFRNDSQ